MNRMWNVTNPHQGTFKKVLCVCSAGLLRSPTIAWILSNPPYNFNTRAVGCESDYALVPIDSVHVRWADAIVCVEPRVLNRLNEIFDQHLDGKELIALDLPDIYGYRSPELVEIATQQLAEAFPQQQ